MIMASLLEELKPRLGAEVLILAAEVVTRMREMEDHIRIIERRVDIMGDHHDGYAILLKLPYDRIKLRRSLRVKARYRLVQQRGIDAKGNPVATCTEYSFTGQPLKVKQTRGTETEVFAYTYDNADRLLTATYRLNDLPEETLADNVYDEVGRLVSERRNGNAKLKTD